MGTPNYELANTDPDTQMESIFASVENEAEAFYVWDSKQYVH